MTDNVLLAFVLTSIAGLSTGIGSALALFVRHTNRKFLSVSLGLSAGVMIYVSFVEILPEARGVLEQRMGATSGAWITVASFFAGIALIALIDRFVPEAKNPHEARPLEAMAGTPNRDKLMRMGLLTALAIGIHNFPEGLATFAAALSDPAIGVSIAVAIAIHNIPEGISVSVPIYYATGSRSRAFWLSFLSGASEPAGALIGYLILRPFLDATVLGLLLASVAGIMVFISLDELFPAAREYGEGHWAIYGLIAGMAIMALSLLMLG